MRKLIVLVLRLATRWRIPKGLQTLPYKSAEQVANAVAVRYQIAHFFDQLVERLVTQLPPSLLKEALAQNLAEERGQSEMYGLAHWQGRKQLIEALGFQYAAWEPSSGLEQPQNVNPAAHSALVSLRGLVDRSSIEGGAMLACYEALVVLQYQVLLEALAITHKYLSDDDLMHLRQHAQLDPRHSKEAFDGIIELIENPYDLLIALLAIHKTKKIWTKFWSTVLPPIP